MGLHYDTDKINDMIMRYIPERTGLQKTLFDAMDDAMEAGGKRIRPILMYETYLMFSSLRGNVASDNTIAPFMAAIEMLHTSSLIHDDLPCMDNDILRRGKPTTWYVYGVDMATLAGDGLMIETFSVMGKAVSGMRNKETGSKALYTLALKAGIYGMVGGQTVDVEMTGKPIDKEKLDFIYRLKTGALIEASMMIGAILGGAREEEIRTVEKIACNVGMAFQIRDDILDEISTEAQLGKPIHSDEENNKTTYVTLYGCDAAEGEVERRSREAVELLDGLGGNSTVLKGIIEVLINRTK